MLQLNEIFIMRKGFSLILGIVLLLSLASTAIASECLEPAIRTTNDYLFTGKYLWNFVLFTVGIILVFISTLFVVKKDLFKVVLIRKVVYYLNPIYGGIALINFILGLTGVAQAAVIIGYDCGVSNLPDYILSPEIFPWVLIYLDSSWNLVLGIILIFLYQKMSLTPTNTDV